MKTVEVLEELHKYVPFDKKTQLLLQMWLGGDQLTEFVKVWLYELTHKTSCHPYVGWYQWQGIGMRKQISCQ